MKRFRAARVAAAVLTWVVLTGCATVVIGRPGGLRSTAPDVGSGEVTVVGAVDSPVDREVRNALADLQGYWTQQFPDVFGTSFPPLQGGYFSVDPDAIDPTAYPQGIGCGQDPAAVEGNAFYCADPGTAHSDSISYDRAFLGELADQYGRFLPDLVVAHEFGHAVQARVGSPGPSIATETQADCFAGAWTAWVADGSAAHVNLRTAQLDDLLRGYLLLRDPVGTSTAAQSAHGSGFDRVSAFQEGFDDGPTACRDHFGPDRVFTQGRFQSDLDFATQGNARFAELQGLMERGLTGFWTSALPDVFGEQFPEVSLEPFNRTPRCADADLLLVYCADEELIGYDEPDLARPAYELGDFAVVTAVSIPYGLAARDVLGLSDDDRAAYESAVCLSGWFGAAVTARQVPRVLISPGDLDESVQFLLEYGSNERVLPGVDRSGFELVDLFRQGFIQGPAACDVGV
ncbi:neutral zinc metallopeptidase [Geodermatophilus sp. URMC 64]